MSVELKDLVQLNRELIKPAIDTLSAAFQDYPLLNYYYPDDITKRKIAHYFCSVAVYAGMHYGEVYANSPCIEGVAVWVPSTEYPFTFLKLLQSVPLSVLFGLGRYGGNKMKKAGEYIDNVHCRLVPFKHWYLYMVGVQPQFQRRSYASKLIRTMLERIDAEGIPCYLETLDERNMKIYEHLGFKIIDESIIPDTNLKNWAMLRE